jgi:hypothetical protein
MFRMLLSEQFDLYYDTKKKRHDTVKQDARHRDVLL